MRTAVEVEAANGLSNENETPGRWVPALHTNSESMMGYPDHQQSSSGGTIIAVVAVTALLLLGGLVAVGVGSWFFVRTEVSRNEGRARDVMQAEQAKVMAERARAEALAAEMQAKVQAAQAKALAEARQNEAAALDQIDAALDRALAEQTDASAKPNAAGDSTLTSANATEILVQVDEAGQTQVDNRSVDRDALEEVIRQAADGPNAVVQVRLRVDPRCKFGDVVEIQSVCREAGVFDVSLETAEE
jgi:biopolymer transport protein ExbD